MVRTTREQRKRLLSIYHRCKLYDAQTGHGAEGLYDSMPLHVIARPLTYLQFRRTVAAGWGCIMVKWCNMWVGIEPDGYAHT